MARPSERLEVGDYVLLEYPEKRIPRAPSRMHPTYRGPLIVTEMERPDIVKCVDIVTNSEVTVHEDSLRKFHAPDHILPEDLLEWAAADHPEEYIVEKIKAHRFKEGAKRKTPYTLELQVKWLGYSEKEPNAVTWEPYSKLKEAEKVDDYVKKLKLPMLKEKNKG